MSEHLPLTHLWSYPISLVLASCPVLTGTESLLFKKKNPLLRYKPMDTYSEWIYLTLFIYRYIFIINAYSYLSEPMIKGRPDLISTGTAGVYRGSVMTRPPSCTPGPVTPRPPSYPKVHTR